MEKRQSPQQVVLRILDSYVEKNEIRTFPHIIYKNKCRWSEDLNRGLEAIKLLEESCLGINCNIIFRGGGCFLRQKKQQQK